ncbi:MAG TPA: FAD-dependent oxidoreductase [Blastocatellia bacterium]|nr:FAD-dependent oxidoreductase [Blastocatellia bacterium]
MSCGPYDVVIIGAGIVGSACSVEFSRAGLRTGIIEASVTGGGTTAAGMGHLVVMDDSPAQFALTKYSLELWTELADELPPAVEFDPCGTIWVASDEQELAAARKKKELYDAGGVSSQIIDCNTLERAEPNLRKGLAGGLLVERDSVLYPPLAAAYFIEQAASLGASLHRSAAIEITRRGLRLADGSFIDAGIIINAAGVFAPSLTPELPVRRRKGHLVITDRYPGWARHQLVELGYLKSAHSNTSDSVAFNVQPRVTGQLLIGSSRQFGIDDAGVDDVILSRMMLRACEYMPGLKDLSAIRVWTGFRPATADNLPFIGPWPGRDNLFIAAGHEGLGITTSLGTARILADQVLGRASKIPITPYLPSRLA